MFHFYTAAYFRTRYTVRFLLTGSSKKKALRSSGDYQCRILAEIASAGFSRRLPEQDSPGDCQCRILAEIDCQCRILVKMASAGFSRRLPEPDSREDGQCRILAEIARAGFSRRWPVQDLLCVGLKTKMPFVFSKNDLPLAGM